MVRNGNLIDFQIIEIYGTKSKKIGGGTFLRVRVIMVLGC